MPLARALLLTLVCPGWCGFAIAGESVVSHHAPAAVVNLSGDWAFAYTPAKTASPPPAAAFAVTMPVPGCWDDQFDRSKAVKLWPNARCNPDFRPLQFSGDPDASLPYLLGTGWYRRRIDVPAAWKGRQITLQVGRVVMEAWVYVNGREVHHHLGHSTNWEAPLGPHLAYGKPNELVIAVDNTRTDRIGCVIRGWQGRSAGIFGPVALRLAGSARIADLYVSPDAGRLNWRVEVQGNLPKPSELRWQIVDPNTKQIIASGAQSAAGEQTRWSCDAAGLKPWSDRQASLYQLEASLYAGDSCLDVCKQPFGLRRLTAAGMGLRLNGEPIFLRGVCDHICYPLTCTPPLDLESYRKHVRLLKQLGFNWIRCHTWVPTEPYMQAADELGIMFQVEPPLGYAMAEWRDILRACRKHPSAAIYCCGNEETLNEKKIEYLSQCAAELRSTVPDALFNPQEALRGIEYDCGIKGIMGKTVDKPFWHNPTRLARLKEFSDVIGQFTWGWVSYSSLLGEPDKIDRRLACYERPCLVHELGITKSYLDLNLESRYEKLRIGPDLYAAVRLGLAKAGLLDRAGVYFRNSAAWQRLILKDAMETARLSRCIAGYDLLGVNDSHWHRTGYACGLLNEFDEFKPGCSVDEILAFNNESVLLVGKKRERTLAAGEPLRRDISLSWFGHGTLRGAALRWSLTAADGSVLAKGEQDVAPIESGALRRIAVVEAATPKLDQPQKVALTVELVHSGCRLHNHWDYWIFPSGESVVPESVQVATSLDMAAVKKLVDGQRVVLLGSKPFPARATSFQMERPTGDIKGHLATVIARHPLTDRFPHDGYCDWQFAKMLENGAAVQLDAVPEAFDPILEVVSSYKTISKQAAVFEWRVGKGRLLVCSLNLSASDPAAMYFRRCLIAYAGGERFQPRRRVAPEELVRLANLGSRRTPATMNADQGFDRRGQLPKNKTNP